ELRAWQWVGNTDSYVVGASHLDQAARGHDVLEPLSQIAQLDEKPDADAFDPQAFSGRENFRHGGALVHVIEYALAAAFRPDPSFAATRRPQGARHAQTDEVGPDLDGERDATVIGGYGGGEGFNPVCPEAKDIVGEPDMVGRKSSLEIRHLGGHLKGGALQIAVAPDRL